MTERTYLAILKEYPDVLSVQEVAKILRIGKNKAYTLVVNTRVLSSIKMGGKIIVPKMRLIQFLLDTKNYQMNPE